MPMTAAARGRSWRRASGLFSHRPDLEALALTPLLTMASLGALLTCPKWVCHRRVYLCTNWYSLAGRRWWVSILGGAVNWCQRTAGSGGSQGFPVSASRMASSAVMPWVAAESR
jgi:hypothetical protein